MSMPDSSATAAPDAFDVEACFRRCIDKRRRNGSTVDRDRRIRAATREVEFQLGEWERDTGGCGDPARLRLRALSLAEAPQSLIGRVRDLLRRRG